MDEGLRRRGSASRSSTPPPHALREQQDDFARTIAGEAAKPITTARVEAARAVLTFQFAAAEARDDDRRDGRRWTRRSRATASSASRCGCPIGVVGAITPFNFPLNLVAHKLAPAIAAGCPVVLKPASQTPFSSLALADLLVDECGLPAELDQRRDGRRRDRWATPSSTTPTSP